MLKACIFKYSHFCLLTNNAIGHLNHFRFLLFLASFLLTAATVVTYSGLALNFYVEKRNLWDAFVKVSPRRVERMNWTVLCQVCITVFLADQFLIVYFNYRSIIIVCLDFTSRLSNRDAVLLWPLHPVLGSLLLLSSSPPLRTGQPHALRKLQNIVSRQEKTSETFVQPLSCGIFWKLAASMFSESLSGISSNSEPKTLNRTNSSNQIQSGISALLLKTFHDRRLKVFMKQYQNLVIEVSLHISIYYSSTSLSTLHFVFFLVTCVFSFVFSMAQFFHNYNV